MPDAEKLTPADPSELAAPLAYASRYQGRKRVHQFRGDCLDVKEKTGTLACNCPFQQAARSDGLERLPF